jgi:antitoxin component HigA of HigAB toxin-antitoxin module
VVFNIAGNLYRLVAAVHFKTSILFRMEQLGLSRTDLEPYIGGSGRVSEVLSGLRIPLENLVSVEHHWG